MKEKKQCDYFEKKGFHAWGYDFRKGKTQEDSICLCCGKTLRRF